MKRKYVPTVTTTALVRKPPRKRQYRQYGLVPTYRGFQPRQFIRGEWKYLDVTVNVVMDTSGVVLLLNGLGLGNGASQRVGQNIAIRSIEFRLLSYVNAGTGVDQVHRYALVVDRQANATAMTGAQYLNAATIYGLRLLENRKRFKTLYDKSRYMNATAEPNSGCYTHKYIKLKRPLITEYNTGNAGTIADIVSNSLYLYGIGSSAPGATAGFCTGYVRIRYTDM